MGVSMPFSRAVVMVPAAMLAPNQPVHRAADERLVRRQHGRVEIDAGVVVDGDFHGLRGFGSALALWCTF
jgi:hypothetical protein